MSSSTKPHYEANPDEVTHDEQNNIWTFKPKGFSIIWGNDKRYWNLPDEKVPEAEQTAELVQVCWLELTGTTKQSLSAGSYAIQFEVSMKPGAFGWNGCPVFMMAKIGKKGRYKWTKINLSDQGLETQKKSVPAEPFQIQVPKDGEDNQLYFGLYEVWTGKWKGGLVIHRATVRKVT